MDEEYVIEVDDILREDLASISHAIWAHWMSYLFSKCEDDDLGMVIQWDDAERWKRQVKTPYAELTEREKDSDREQADKIIDVLCLNGIINN